MTDDDLIDDVGHWLGEGTSFDEASIVPAVFLTWCVNLGLAAPDFVHAAGSGATRLKYRDTSFTAFFTTTAAGELRFSQLNEMGEAFARSHYGDYAEYASSVVLDDKWKSYDVLAAWLTRRLHQPVRHSGTRKWWRFWE